MPSREQLRDFLAPLNGYWWALMGGTASVLLGLVGGLFNTSFPPSIIWLVSYLCLLFAAYRVWSIERVRWTAERTRADDLQRRLDAPVALSPHLEEVRRQVATLTADELALFRYIVACVRLSDSQVADYFLRSGCSNQTMYGVTGKLTFLVQDHPGDSWHVVPEMRTVVEMVLAEQKAAS